MVEQEQDFLYPWGPVYAWIWACLYMCLLYMHHVQVVQ